MGGLVIAYSNCIAVMSSMLWLKKKNQKTNKQKPLEISVS